MKETFKEIKDYENQYLISNLGIVISLKRNTILKPQTYNGYYQIGLNKNSKLKWKTIHRLVANAFIPNSNNKPCVNHIDGNKQNNYVDNLEWVTHSENVKHAFKIGLKSSKGENNGNAKLTENNVLIIHGLYLGGLNLTEIGKIYNVYPSTIHSIINGRNWKVKHDI